MKSAAMKGLWLLALILPPVSSASGSSGCGVVGTLPPPQVAINQVVQSAVSVAEADLGTAVFTHDISRLAPGVEFTTEQELQALSTTAATVQSAGIDNAAQIAGLQAKVVGLEFTLIITYGVAGSRKVLSASLLDRTAFAVRRGLAQGTDFEQLEQTVVAQMGSGNLLADLRARQNAPLIPQLCIQLSPVGGAPPGGSSTDVAPDGKVRATVTLVDADGRAYSGKALTVSRTIVGNTDTVSLLTDGNGQVIQDFSAGSSIAGNVGTVNARYAPPGQKPTEADPKSYHIFTGSGFSATSPDAALTTGASEPVTVSLRENGNPVSGARIDLAPQDGSLSANSVTTGADGKASDTMTMGDVGLAQVTATVHPPGQSPISPFATPETATLSFVVEPKARLTLTAGETDIETGSDTPVNLDVAVGDQRGVGVPVTFSGGDLSVTQTNTDEFGQAETFYAAPASGSGSATITAQATVQGTAFSKSVTISYHEGSLMTGKALPSIFSPPYVTSTSDPAGSASSYNCTTLGGSFVSASGNRCSDGPLGSPTPLPVSLSTMGAFVTDPPDPPYSGDASVQLNVKQNGASAISLDGSAIRVGFANFVLELDFAAAGELAFHAADNGVGGLARMGIAGPNPTAFGSWLLFVDANNHSAQHDTAVSIPAPGKMTFLFWLVYAQNKAPAGSQPNSGTWHADITFTPSP